MLLGSTRSEVLKQHALRFPKFRLGNQLLGASAIHPLVYTLDDGGGKPGQPAFQVLVGGASCSLFAGQTAGLYPNVCPVGYPSQLCAVAQVCRDMLRGPWTSAAASRASSVGFP